MESDCIKIRTSIDPQLKKHTLLKGTALAGLGAILLVGSASFMPAAQLKYWGLWIFLFSGLLMAMGLIPYRTLSLLEATPNELILNKNTLLFTQKKKVLLDIPNRSIEQLGFTQRKGIYGLQVRLKKNLPEKIRLMKKHLSKNDFVSFENGVLFFPYFSQKTCRFFRDEFTAVMDEADVANSFP